MYLYFIINEGGRMEKRTFSLLAIGIWGLCFATLLGIYLFRVNKRSMPEYLVQATAIFHSLNDEEKTNVARYDTAILRLTDEHFHLIGRGFEVEENDLLSKNRMAIKKLEVRIADAILFERKSMVSEAVRTLNNAEKRCLQDRFASIMYRNGNYYLYIDPKKYAEYVTRYGVECKECEESARASQQE